MFSKQLPEMARSAETWPKRHVPRPTKAEVLADVPGARNVKPELLPEDVQHLSNVSAGVVAKDPNVPSKAFLKLIYSHEKET